MNILVNWPGGLGFIWGQREASRCDEKIEGKEKGKRNGGHSGFIVCYLIGVFERFLHEIVEERVIIILFVEKVI